MTPRVERPQIWQLPRDSVIANLLNVNVRPDLLVALYPDYKRSPKPQPPPDHAPIIWDTVRSMGTKIEIPDPFLSASFRQDITNRWLNSVQAAMEARYPVPPAIVKEASGASPQIRNLQTQSIARDLKSAAEDLSSSMKTLDPDHLAEDFTRIRAKLTSLAEVASPELGRGIKEVIDLVDQSAKKHGIRLEQPSSRGPAPGF